MRRRSGSPPRILNSHGKIIINTPQTHPLPLQTDLSLGPPPPHSPSKICFKIKSGFILSVYTLRFPFLQAFPVMKFGFSMNEQKITDGV